MPLTVTAVFTTPISEDTQQPDVLWFKERNHTVIEYIGRGNRVFVQVEFDDGQLAVSVDESLLTDTPHLFDVAE